MTEPDDLSLLREFAATESEAAFSALVSRHLNLVDSVALRSVGNAHGAQEISQAVFIILARKAKSLGAKRALDRFCVLFIPGISRVPTTSGRGCPKPTAGPGGLYLHRIVTIKRSTRFSAGCVIGLHVIKDLQFKIS